MLRAITLIIIFVAVKGDGCIRLSFGENGNVCVCNSTYCDSTEVPKFQHNEFVWYISTKDSKMMEYSINNFSTENEVNISQTVTSNVLTIKSNVMYQKIFGFGGAMTDAAALNIRNLSDGAQHKLLESYYGPNGSRYTFCRIPIAGSDFSTRAYTYDDDPTDITLNHFSLVKEDEYKINYLNYIKDIMPDPRELKILATSWSAPAWMKKSNNIKYGSLKDENYKDYADYIVKFIDAYKKRDIEIWGITPGNEPLDGIFPFFPFNSMAWFPNQSANWIVDDLSPALSKAGYENLTILAPDDQRLTLAWYIGVMFQNEEAKKLISGFAYHWYTDSIPFSSTILTEMHIKYPDKFILMTEACNGVSTFDPSVVAVMLGSWDRGEKYALDIIENLSHWGNGWIDWNLALNEEGGPNWVRNFVDSPIIVIPQKDEFYKQPTFYAIAHFSKFVPPGSHVIFSELEKGFLQKKYIEAIAFLTPEEKIVIVIVNKHVKNLNLTITDTVANKTINLDLPAKSIHTISYLA